LVLVIYIPCVFIDARDSFYAKRFVFMQCTKIFISMLMIFSVVVAQDDRAIRREKFLQACADLGAVAKDCLKDSLDAAQASFITGAQRDLDQKEGLSPEQLQEAVQQGAAMVVQAATQAPQTIAQLADQAGFTAENLAKTAEQITLELQQAADLKQAVEQEELAHVGATVEKVVDKVAQIAQESVSTATENDNTENSTTTLGSTTDAVPTKNLGDQVGHQDQNLVVDDQKDQSRQQNKASWVEQVQATMAQSMTTVSNFVGNHPYATVGSLVTVVAVGVYAYQKYYDQDAQFEQD
jgi:hypothetical protein